MPKGPSRWSQYYFKQYASFKVFPSCKVIWEEFDSMEFEEVDRAPSAANLASCVLELCTSWLIKAAWERTCEWVWEVASSSFRKGVVPPALKKELVAPTQGTIA